MRFAMKKLTIVASLALLGVTAAHAGLPQIPQPIITDACKYIPLLDKKDPKLCGIAPEIDPATAAAGLTLLLGGLAVVRGRIRNTKQA
jgi:hypothetical protein